jgi:hypothetical protein
VGRPLPWAGSPDVDARVRRCAPRVSALVSQNADARPGVVVERVTPAALDVWLDEVLVGAVLEAGVGDVRDQLLAGSLVVGDRLAARLTLAFFTGVSTRGSQMPSLLPSPIAAGSASGCVNWRARSRGQVLWTRLRSLLAPKTRTRRSASRDESPLRPARTWRRKCARGSSVSALKSCCSTAYARVSRVGSSWIV